MCVYLFVCLSHPSPRSVASRVAPFSKAELVDNNLCNVNDLEGKIRVKPFCHFFTYGKNPI